MLATIFLGLMGTTAAFLLFLKGIGQIGASRASIFVNLVPVFGVLFSAVILGETPGAAALFGGALVIAGVRLLNR
jgi:drug/metabolite transporter (DMT)-like permease